LDAQSLYDYRSLSKYYHEKLLPLILHSLKSSNLKGIKVNKDDLTEKITKCNKHTFSHQRRYYVAEPSEVLETITEAKWALPRALVVKTLVDNAKIVYAQVSSRTTSALPPSVDLSYYYDIVGNDGVVFQVAIYYTITDGVVVDEQELSWLNLS